MLSRSLCLTLYPAAVGGSVVGFKDCRLSDPPLIHERLASAGILGVMWAGTSLYAPFFIAAKLECLSRRRECDMLNVFKMQCNTCTGRYCSTSPTSFKNARLQR